MGWGGGGSLQGISRIIYLSRYYWFQFKKWIVKIQITRISLQRSATIGHDSTIIWVYRRLYSIFFYICVGGEAAQIDKKIENHLTNQTDCWQVNPAWHIREQIKLINIIILFVPIRVLRAHNIQHTAMWHLMQFSSATTVTGLSHRNILSDIFANT